MADNEFKLQVLGATDIVALVSQSVALKRRGKNYVGLCPFHQEKSPSFNVDPVKGYYKCFGCKESGNAIDFVMKRDRLDFLEAMKFLGERAGLEMPKFGVTKQKTSEKQALLDVHAKAADYFHRTLMSPVGAPAREYLATRGFTATTIEAFRLGYAPPGWDHLLRSKEMAGVPAGLLAVGGLVKARDVERGSGHYDTFRNRLIFPIRDDQSRTIAFGGRVMPGSEDPAKYLNSPETPLFSKSRTIFGLDLARPRIVETRTVAVVEGYTDVAMANQFGAGNVVSILGTAMTDQHLAILRRFADRVVLLFDADTAGETAVNRSVELFLAQPIEIAIATLPDELDPDEFLLRDGLAAFDAMLKGAEDALSFKWKMLEREVGAAGTSLTGQQRAVENYLELLAKARSSAGGSMDEIRWGAVLRRVERLTGIPMEQLSRRFHATKSVAGRGRMGGGPAGSRAGSSAGSGGVGGSRPAGGPGRVTGLGAGPNSGVTGGGGVASNSSSSDEGPGIDPSEMGYVNPNDENRYEIPGNEQKVPVVEARSRAERWILGILLAEPGRWIHVQREVSPELFGDPARKVLAEFYWDRQRNEGEPTFSELLGELPGNALRELATELLEEAEKLGNLETTLREALRYFEEERGHQKERSQVSALVNRNQEDAEQIDVLRDLFARVKQRAAPPRGTGFNKQP